MTDFQEKRVATAIDRNEIVFIPSFGILRDCAWGKWTWRLGFAFLQFRISIGFGRRTEE